jgi:hypothetical protein
MAEAAKAADKITIAVPLIAFSHGVQPAYQYQIKPREGLR